MPFLETVTVRLRYQVEGREDAPWLILSNSLGTNLDMWLPQIPALLERYRVLRYDTRGHGQSSVTPGPYSIEQLAGDVIALMNHLNIDRAHFCGLSMGGMIGMWLAANKPDRIDRLVLSNTSARMGAPEAYDARIEKVKKEGMKPIVPAVLDRWFTRDFQRYAAVQVKLVGDMLLQMSPEGYAAGCAAVRDMDLQSEVARISAPTLVIAGKHDLATPPVDGREIADQVPGARYVELNAAHLSNWEVAQSFTTQVIDFLRN